MTIANCGLKVFRSCLALSLCLGLLGCQTPSSSDAQAPREEKSVRPGVNKEYLQASFDGAKWLGRFERESREIYAQRQEMLTAARVRRGQTVADIGAGTGLFTLLFADRVGSRGKVYAVDINTNFLALIQRRAAEAGWRNIETVLGTERSVQLPRNALDVAFVCDTYHHFEYPQSSLASIHQALRAGGELVIVDFKRVPGQSSDWVLNHVRAGQEEVTAEVEAAGFKKIEQVDLLKENYFLRFRKVKR